MLQELNRGLMNYWYARCFNRLSDFPTVKTPNIAPPRGIYDVPPLRQARGRLVAAKRAASQRAHALRAVRQFAWLEVGSVKVVSPRPAPPD